MNPPKIPNKKLSPSEVRKLAYDLMDEIEKELRRRAKKYRIKEKK